jgi:hypothetical protein
MKYETKECEGYWMDDPENIFSVRIALGEWDGLEDDEDQDIFYYMDGEPLKVGSILCEDEGFYISKIEEEV